MSESTGYKHSASDKKLDHAADAADASSAAADAKHGTGPGHDAAKVARHDDSGKDRLFEGREQRDDAEKASERNRIAKDQDRHAHPPEDLPADA